MTTDTPGSFVSAVLATAGRPDKDDLNSKLGQLSRKIDDIKMLVHDSLMKKYAEFYPLFDTTRQLRSRVSEMQAEMEGTLSNIEKQIKTQLSCTTGDYDSLQTRCNESKVILVTLNQLVQLNEAFQSVEQSLAMKSYVEGTRTHMTVRKILGELEALHGDHIRVLPSLSRRSVAQAEMLETAVMQRWNELVSWKKLEDGASGSQLMGLNISKAGGVSNELADLAQSFENLGILNDVVKKFGDRLMKNIMLPVVCNSAELRKVDNANIFSIHVAAVTNSVAASDHAVRANNGLVAVSDIFLPLHSYLLHVEISVDSGSESAKCSLMSVLGRSHARAVLELMVRDCLLPSIPTSRAALRSYSETTVNFAKIVNARLVEVGFVSTDDRTVLDYVGGIETLFANKRCQDVLEEARALMTSDIHNIVQVTSESSSGKQLILPPVDGNSNAKKSKTTNLNQNNDFKLDPVFCFPTCHISVATQKLVEMAYRILREATSSYGNTSSPVSDDEKSASSSMESCIQLFYCVRNMFEMFTTVVPVYHRDRLAKIPQMAAIHHNDCMYIAHHLTLLGHQYRRRLPQPLCDGAATFVDLVPVLRRSGTRCFLDQLSAQKSQIVQTLNAAHGFAGLRSEESHETAEHAINQALYQLRHLLNVWRDVLPAHVCAKAIGTLLNTAIVEIISSIVSLEDITKEDGDLLNELLSKFASAAQTDIVTPVVNLCPSPLVKLVPSWGRLEEVKYLLTACLQDVVDRWTAGPLAAEMTTTEVKQMIRALFSNTDQRSAALAAIK